MCPSFLVHESQQILLRATAFVSFGGSRALGKIFDCRVGTNALFFSSGFGILGFGIDFGDQNVGLGSVVLCDGLPDRS